MPIDSLNQIEIARIYLRQLTGDNNKKNADGDSPITALCLEHARLVIECKKLKRYNTMLKEALKNAQDLMNIS